MNFRMVLIFVTTSVACISSGVYAHCEESDLARLQVGMTKTEVEAMYPDMKLNIGGIELVLEGRFGNFSRDGKDYEGGTDDV